MNWLDTIKTIAPVVASALGGPLAGVAVTAIGELFGIDAPSAAKIQASIENGQMTGEQISGLRQLELKLKSEEAERGFKYAELEYKTVIQTTIDGFWLTDLEGRLLDVNTAYCNMVGYSRD